MLPLHPENLPPRDNARCPPRATAPRCRSAMEGSRQRFRDAGVPAGTLTSPKGSTSVSAGRGPVRVLKPSMPQFDNTAPTTSANETAPGSGVPMERSPWMCERPRRAESLAVSCAL